MIPSVVAKLFKFDLISSNQLSQILMFFLFSLLISGVYSNSIDTIIFFDKLNAMYTSEGAPDFVVDQGMYYPVDASYGYYCTGNNLDSLYQLYILSAYRRQVP